MAGKADLISDLRQKVAGLTHAQAEAVVDATLKAITEAMQRGQRVRLPGFGSFQVSERKARVGRNPRTGAPIQIAASRGVRFKQAKALKDALTGDGSGGSTFGS